ncbi:MAG: PSD1 and planctomycete cytochrome C domain-containing protein [Planctomycetaceae bacterium]
MNTCHSIATVAVVLSGSVCLSADVDFSRDIRPILSDKCFLCHGPDAEHREADLRLDVRESAIDAGAITAGDPATSEILKRVLSQDPETVMPPPSRDKQITAEEAQLLKQWIADGAEYSNHWAFERPQRPDVPAVTNTSGVNNPIDNFVVAKLEASGLSPSQPADKVTLVRRLFLDLLGLPPSPEQVDEFVADADPHARANLIERLLQSPHFGERWARWWLDAARYADSDGYEKDKPRTVWFYRDWVIDAMNEDMPYHDFIVQQIAGDLLPDAGQSEIVATGFLRNSMVNEEGGADPEQFRVEAMFDRMDTIGKAVLGITTQCAQCHTHKYDPLSQREYYSMYAALNNFHEATATVFTEDQEQQRQNILAEVNTIETAIKQRIPDWQSRLDQWVSQQLSQRVHWTTIVPDDLPYEGQKFRLLPDGSILSESYAPTRTNTVFQIRAPAGRITAFRLDALQHPQLPRGGPGRSIYGTAALSEFEVKVAPTDQPGQSQSVRLLSAWADVNPEQSDLPLVYRDRDPTKDDRVTGPVDYAIDGNPKTAWSTDIDPGRRNQNRHAVFVPEQPLQNDGDVILTITLKQLHGGWNSDDNQNYLLGRYRFSITDNDAVAAANLPSSVEAVLSKPADSRTRADQHTLFGYWRTTLAEFAAQNQQIEQLWKSFPETESQLVVQALDAPKTTHVFERGDFLKPGEEVVGGVPGFLNAWPQSNEPDRLKFARWMVADDAPTTARVIVNRLWQAYFGRGIVATPEDFGFQSPAPSHRELIDWLAVELMEHNWSLKHVHRLIANSKTYQQSSVMTPQLQAQDPYNELLARSPRLRVPAEMVRDVALAASGLLQTQVGGPSVYPPAPDFLFQPPASYGPKQWYLSKDEQQYRRSLYVHRYRSVAYPTLQVFDAPKGDAACVRRPRSNTPLQALVLLNEPQFVESARAMAARVLREGGESDISRLQYAHRLCVSRRATPDELAILSSLLEQQRRRIESRQVDVQPLAGTSSALFQQLTGRTAEDFAPWVVVCRAILNLDETITKE